jgi:8-oxo-dGTP pyrophosphatase MutT (NUDIX family)
MAEHKRTTVVFPLENNAVLLGMKKRGFGQGWWNGFGGKLEPGETYVASAIRETNEEVGLTLTEQNLIHAADILFRFDGAVDVVSRAYIAMSYEGEPLETEEMRPEWFVLDTIPYETMWPGDDQWIPKILDDAAQAPLGFVIDFTGDNQFLAIEQVDPQTIAGYF